MNERVAGLLKKIRDICFSSRLAFVVSAFIFVILLASTIVSSRISSDAVIKEMMIRSDEILSHIMEKVESSMDEMDAIWISFLRIHINTAEPELTITDDYERYCFYKSTAGLFEAHPYVVSVYIYYGDGEKVYYQTRTSSGIADRKSFPDNAVYEEFEKKDRLSGVSAARVAVIPGDSPMKEENGRVISCIRKLPLGSFTTKNTAIMNISLEPITAAAAESILLTGCSIIVEDHEGNPFIAYPEGGSAPGMSTDQNRIKKLFQKTYLSGIPCYSGIVDGRRCYMTSKRSDASGKLYTVIIPESILLKPVKTVNTVMFSISAAIFLLGIIISAVINHRYFKPVLGILKRFGGAGEANRAETGGNEFSRIHMHIDNILQENRELERKLGEYFSVYKERVLRALLESNPPDSEGEEKLGFSNDYEWFQVFVVEMKGGRDKPEENTAAEIGRILGEFGRVEEISMDKNRFAVILCMKIKCGFTVLEESLKPVFTRDSGLKLKIAAGDAVGSIKDIHISYREAVQCLFEIKRSTGGLLYGFSPGPQLNRQHHGETYINNRELIQKVILYIENHYMEDIGLETIARHVFFSPSYLGKVFREISGRTFTDYLIEIRMKTAARLLTEGDENISKIAEKVGYSSVQSFSKAFRNYYQCSPGEYRKKSFVPG